MKTSVFYLQTNALAAGVAFTIIRYTNDLETGKRKETSNTYELTQSSLVRIVNLLADKQIRISHVDPSGKITMYRDPNYGRGVVTYLSREDLVGCGYDVSDLSNDDIASIAGEMGESYTASGAFWEHLRSCADYYDVPRNPDYEDEDEDYEDEDYDA